MSRLLTIFVCCIVSIGRNTGVPIQSSQNVTPASTRSHEKIVGGKEMNITKVPWMVSLQNDGIFHFCGGSIIGPQWIITAAHCVTMHVIDPSILQVRVGATNRMTDGELFKADAVIVHPDYIPATYDFNIALIRLKVKLKFGDKVNARGLAEEKDDLSKSIDFLISGWGATHNPSESAISLRGTYVRIVQSDICNEAYGGRITRNMFCAGDLKNGGKDACAGDSGGPLSSDYPRQAIYGIISWGKGCGLVGFPGVYTDVRTSRKWIKSVTGI